MRQEPTPSLLGQPSGPGEAKDLERPEGYLLSTPVNESYVDFCHHTSESETKEKTSSNSMILSAPFLG